jgi:RNA-directed DNA polymerase
MAKWLGLGIVGWIETKLEQDLGLNINRDKTAIVRLKEKGSLLNFLGMTFRLDNDLKGQGWRYVNLFPSKKAVEGIKAKIRALTYSGYKKPLKTVVEEVNETLRHWSPYYSIGYPRKTFRDLNHFIQGRFCSFLRNRSQRVSRPLRPGENLYAGLQRFGLTFL